MNSQGSRIWGARLLIGLVFLVNVQCALAFLLSPTNYVAGFELGGVPGKGMVQGMGILFLMWNVPYAFALTDPFKKRTSLFEAVVMQSIGLVGETILLVTITEGHSMIRSTVSRFIAFDGAGLVLLLIAVWLVHQVSAGAALSPAGKT